MKWCMETRCAILQLAGCILIMHALEASRTAYWCVEKQGVNPVSQQQLPTQVGMQHELNHFRCFVDGSWSDGGRAGIGLHLVLNGKSVEWVSQGVSAVNATQAEAKAVLEGCKLLLKHTNGVGIVLSDSIEVIGSVNNSPPGLHDWRASSEVWNIWVLKKNSGNMRTEYCNREDDNITVAHRLANWGRTCNGFRNGFSTPHFSGFSCEECLRAK